MNNQTKDITVENVTAENMPLKKTWQEPELIHLILNGGPNPYPFETGAFHTGSI